jgi:hypothetical protein
LFDYVVPGLGNQVESLLRAGHEVQAAELLDVMLEHKNKDIDPQRFGLAESVVSQFWVNYLVTHILPDLSKVNPSWLVIVLESKIRQVAEWELGNNPGYSPPEFLRAPGFMPPIDEAGGDHSPFPDQLVGALRDAVDALISSDTDQAEQLITRWLGERMLVFRRLAFHLLAKHGDLLGECRQHAVRQENLSLTGCRYEYREFLKSQFRQLPEDQQRQIENWILAL